MKDETLPEDGPKVTFDTGSQRSALLERFDLIPYEAAEREARRWALGMQKYGLYNWQKGQPAGDVMSHLLRHAMLHAAGDRTEDHLAAIRCNAAMLMYFEEHLPAMFADYPGPEGK